MNHYLGVLNSRVEGRKRPLSERVLVEGWVGVGGLVG